MHKKGFTVLELLITIVIIAILILITVPYLARARRTGQIGATLDTLRNICSAEEAYFAKMTYKTYGKLSDLASKKFLDDRFLQNEVIINGYKYSSYADNLKFKVTATPIKENYPTFYVDETYVIKFANGAPIGSH